MIYIFVARFLLDYIAMLGFRHTGLRISAAIRLSYLRSLMALPVSTVDAIPQGHAAAIITITANQLQDGISEKLCLLVQHISLVISATVVAFIFSWLLAVVTVTGFVFVVLVYIVTLLILVKQWNKVQEADREGAATASETISSIRMVAACGAEGKMREGYGGWVKEAARHGQRMSKWIAIQSSLGKTAALCFWWAIRLFATHRIETVEALLVVITSILTIVMAAGSISAPLSAVSRASGAAATFYPIIDAPKPKADGVKGSDVVPTRDIVLDQVNFTYISRPDQRVLKNVTLTFPEGKTTAIVGPSGSGKSTIVALIQRWYELGFSMTDLLQINLLRNGSITTGGRNLYEIDMKWWRSQIGLVQQEPVLFNGTIFENVAHGLIGTQWESEPEEVKRALVAQACEGAFANEFITRLPDGYDTLCGDSGIHLSGGQRQRIAIARCIIRRPSILILDEATSAIDVRSEQKVQAALDRAAQNRTTIVIAHRLSTIQKADNIVVLHKGTVVQQGSHEKLMKNRAGLYYRLVNAQLLTDNEETVESSSTSTDALDSKDEAEYSAIDSVDCTVQSSSNAKRSAFRDSIRALARLFIEQKSDWHWYILILLGAAGAGAAFPVQAYLFARLITLFAYSGDYLRDQTQFWCLMMVALAVGVGVCYFVLGWACNTVSFVSCANHIISAYRIEYFQNLLRKPISFFDDAENSTGALSARIASDPAQLQQLLGINAASMLTCIFNVAGCIAISFYFSWKLSVVVVFSSTPVMIAAGYLRVRYEREFEKMSHTVFAESSKFAIESIGAFRTVSALTMENFICGRYEDLLQRHVRNALWKGLWSTLIFSFSDSVALLCMAFALWYGGTLLSEYELWPFNYLVVYFAVVQGSLAAGQWLSFGPNIAQASSAIRRIRNLRIHEDTSSSSNPLPIEEGEKGIQGPKIELRNVWFKYPTRDVPVLRGLNMTIERGQFAAIVGPSGCGKTSVISLIERFYTPQFGDILFDNTNISSLDLDEYRKSISLVAQEPSIVAGTLRENILMGVDPNTVSESDLDRVCKEAEMYDYIASFPITYDTLVGQKGIALSGGQRQRLSIARALIRNPRLMLLDEATSNLDSETEKSIQKIFEETGKGRTMIVVAHRLATVQNADVIFVMSEGRVVEQGTHRELLRKKGVYWQMCQMQALDSRH
ncbi:ABC transporter-like protein [Westerdykella ornata]|uniref:ABC transporter-like protein n=1 Tax=Westerdykella ornata TaxID=318751 RepID=A0A6A6JYB4_WESOR|nr:ABC transporter-like protein [Westerdykella ornata]KAF2281083.1 ABC transporter-like protein [Westerdykella ornata]